MADIELRSKTELTSIVGTEKNYTQEAGSPFTVKWWSFNTLKLWLASFGVTTVYKQASYAILDNDGYQRIEVDTTAGAVSITLPLMANNRGRRIEIAFVKNDDSNDVITISPHATDANNLSNDLLGSIILAKVGDFLIVQESVNSGCWEVVNERITSQLRLNTYAGYGSTDNKIMRFTNVVENVGNMFSENHVSGYSGNAKGLEITINRSGRYGLTFNHNPNAAAGIGYSLNSTQLTTSITSINVSDRIAEGGTASLAGFESSASISIYLKKNDIIRAHTDGAPATTAARSTFAVSYL